MKELLTFLFRCQHRRTTFPITPARNIKKTGASRSGTYIVCLDCGREFPYNWETMRMETPGRVASGVPTAIYEPQP